MIDQTIPLPQLLQGMARCVREWVLPHVHDPMARTQAELLATLLDELPTALEVTAAEAIQSDTDAACEMLVQLGGEVGSAASGRYRVIDDLVRDNSACKVKLEELADQLRVRGDEASSAQLLQLQRLFVQSLERELGAGVGHGTDFQSMTAKDRGVGKDG